MREEIGLISDWREETNNKLVFKPKDVRSTPHSHAKSFTKTHFIFCSASYFQDISDQAPLLLLPRGKQQIILKISWLHWTILLLRAGIISLQHLWVLIPVVCVLMSPLQALCAAVYSSEKPSTPRGAGLHDSAPGAQQPFPTLSCSDTAKVLSPPVWLFFRCQWSDGRTVNISHSSARHKGAPAPRRPGDN